MKQTFRGLALCAALALITATLAAQDQPERGLYIKADLGANWTDKVELREFYGAPLSPDAELKLDTGFRFGAAVGYQITDWFAGEAEIGYMVNEIDSITGPTYIDDAEYSNLPFLINAKLQLPNASPIVPYIGAGVGFTTTILDADEIAISGTSMSGWDSGIAFAWQAFAGLRYKINDHMSVGAEYHFFWADGVDLEADSTAGTTSDTMSLGKAMTHTVSFLFIYHF